MDLKRLQELAEPLGWSIWLREERESYEGQPKYKLFDRPSGKGGSCLSFGYSLASIASRLEAEYGKLAEQELSIGRILNAVDKTSVYGEKEGYWYQRLTRIADELAVKEPTMVERLKNYKKTYFPPWDNTRYRPIG